MSVPTLPWLVVWHIDTDQGDDFGASVVEAESSADAWGRASKDNFDPLTVLAWVVVPLPNVESVLTSAGARRSPPKPAHRFAVEQTLWLVCAAHPEQMRVEAAWSSAELREGLAVGAIAVNVNLVLAAIFSWRGLRVEEGPVLYRDPRVPGRVSRGIVPNGTIH